MRSTILFLAGLVVMVMAPAAGAQTRSVFNISSPANARTPFEVRVHNECRGPHVFEVLKPPQVSWLKIESAARFALGRGESGPVKVVFDTAALSPDSYDAELRVKCVDCASEPGCTQDNTVFTFQLEVTWTAAELQAIRQDGFLANEILVVLQLAAPAVIDAVAQQLATTYQLTRIESFEARSISAACVRFGIQGGRSVAEAVIAVSTDPRVLFAEPNFSYRSFDSKYNDPLAPLQYGPRKIGADAVHRHSKGKGVRIAIIDTGIDSNQIDLRNHVAATADFTGEKTGNEDWHGTLVAGIIAATPNNKAGIYGVAPGASLIAIKALTPTSKGSIEASGSSAMIAKGMEFAISSKAQVINLSLGGSRSRLLSRQIRASVAAGITLVAAAGNDGPGAPPPFPASLNCVIAVSAIDAKDELYESATRGDFISVVAPGVEIMSTLPGNSFNAFTGTSMAAPHVSGVVALLLEENPALQPGQIKSLLEATARPLGGGGKNALYGSGCVDACKAVAAASGNKKRCN